MIPRLFVAFFSALFFFVIPSVSFASDNGEIFPSAAWTPPGTVAIEGNTVESRQSRQWHVSFVSPAVEPLNLNPFITAAEPPAAAAEQRPTAFEYSDFYNTRRKIHMIASYATIPLFVGEYLAGEKLYDGNGSSTAKSAHGAFTAGLAGLFGLNTITGAWNLWDGRKDPNGRTRRIVHSILMLGADAGFAATASLAPDDDEGGFTSDRSAHRNMAIASMSVAAASYVYMLVTR
jgi:hypothetical protein